MFKNDTGFLIDMDGVIYRENHLIAGAAEWIEYMLQNYIPFVFLTNNSAPTAEDLAIKLKHLGIANLTEKHFYTSALNTADFLAETHPLCSAFSIGETGLASALQARKIPNDSIHPHYVVVGEGNPTLEKLNKAHELIEKGARLIVTNPDNWCPVGSEKTRPGAGALAAYLEASTGQRGYYLGKPNPYMFAQAKKRLGKTVSRFVMIGDTMETDIRGAIEIGMEAYLVLSGSTLLEDTQNYVYQPTRILEGIHELLEEYKSGQPSDRKQSPALSSLFEKSADSHEKSIQRIHGTEPTSPRRRPRPQMVK